MSFATPSGFTGYTGNVVFGGVLFGVRDWRASITSDAIDVTSTNDGGWQTNITAPVKMEGSFRINADCTNYALLANFPEAMTCVVLPTRIVLELGGFSGQTITANVYLTRVDVINPAEADVTLEYSFISTGAISFAT